jgi:hypothetical protein
MQHGVALGVKTIMHIPLSSRPSTARRSLLQGAAATGLLALAPQIARGAKEDSLTQQQVTLIDLSTKQRMLLQRCTKLYLQLLLNSRSSDAKRLLSDSFSRIETAYAKQYAAESLRESNIQNIIKLDILGREYPKFRTLLQKPPSEKALPELVEKSESLVRVANQTAGATDQFLSGSPIGLLTATAGKQCFISQRIATYYFLRSLNHQPDVAARLIGDLMTDYENNARLLEKGVQNTTEIKFLLQLAGTQWPYFKEAINVKTREDPTQLNYNVATAAENMLEVLERTNLLYFKIATG